jgi:acyl-CoA thioesterase I
MMEEGMEMTVNLMDRTRRWALGWGVGLVAAHCSGIVLAAGGAPKTPTPSTPVVLVVGDSLSAEYGIARGAGWVALLDTRLKKDKVSARVVNASISGDTTSGGRSRLPALLKQHQPTHVLIELGGNDALRGLPLAMTEGNLSAMTRAAQTAGAQVVILGMQMPPNYGKAYGDAFAALFGKVAQTHKAAVVPFMLEGVANPKGTADPLKLFQPDRIHPVAEAHPIILGNVWPVLRPLLK